MSTIYHFVPHPHHKRRASLLSPLALTIYIALIALFFTGFKLFSFAFPGVLGYASNIDAISLLENTNSSRQAHNLPVLAVNSQLSEAARLKAEDMFRDDYWAHVSPVGKRPWDFIVSQGYDYSFAGENLAKNFNTSQEVITAWLNSPSHRDNLLSSDYSEIGFAVVDGELDGYKTTLVVQMFGTQRSSDFVSSQDFAKLQEQASEKIAYVSLAEPTLETQSSEVSGISFVKVDSTVVNVSGVSKALLSVFTGFLVSLLVLDIWYSKKKSIPKFTGHTFAHITFLLFILASVWLVLSPGRVL